MKIGSFPYLFPKGFLFIIIFSITSNSALAENEYLNESRINALIKQMTLQEKVRMIHANSSFTSAGVPRLGIPELVMSDGPHGVRMEHGRGWKKLENVNDSGTYLPVGIALAATWNTSLGYEYGKVLGSEAKHRGKDVILGPGINIMRSPLNGRNFEYQSEDPYLISKMAVGYIKGVQSQGVSTCVKHFAANNQEFERNFVDVQMSERALREIYLPGFKAAVQEANVNTVMSAYDKFRGQYAAHNTYLINKVLKGEWGFKGIVISDWGAVHNWEEALLNGTDVEMGSDLAPTSRDYNNFYLGDTVGGVVTAPFSITNTGSVYGGEVAQLYVHKNNSSIQRADKELKGFQKVFLKPNETKSVSITLGRDAFQYFDEAKHEWAVEAGAYTVQVGSSSRSILLKEMISIK